MRVGTPSISYQTFISQLSSQLMEATIKEPLCSFIYFSIINLVALHGGHHLHQTINYSVQNQQIIGLFFIFNSAKDQNSETQYTYSVIFKFEQIPIFYLQFNQKYNHMIRLQSQPLFSSLLSSLSFNVHFKNKNSYYFQAPQKKPGTFHHRIKQYNKYLNKYNRTFLIRPPNLESKNKIQFPIKIPMRVRHTLKPKKQYQKKWYSTTQKVYWNRLTPNQILLAFENHKYLSFEEIVEGLKYLSEVPGQQKYNWNQHQWISSVLRHVTANFSKIKQGQYLNFYYLMKKLNYKSQRFWKKLYKKLEENIYDLYPSEFQKFYMKYYHQSQKYFSPAMKEKFDKLMEGRLREFKTQNILLIYSDYAETNRLDDYWMYNVFVPLFKNENYRYTPNQVCQIFRFMMIKNHEKDTRLYDNLYKRIMKFEFKSKQQIEDLIEVVTEVKDIFESHRVDPYLSYLADAKANFKLQIKQKKLSLYEIVRQDLKFYMIKNKKSKIKKQDIPEKVVQA